MKNFKLEPTDLNYPDLPIETQGIIEDLCTETLEETEGHGPQEPEQIEFQSRDGFMAFSHNHGGITIKHFTDIGYIMGSGYMPSHVEASKEIERQYDYAMECAREEFFDAKKEDLKALGIDSKDHEKLNYHDLYEMKQGSLAEELSEYESESTSFEHSSVMYEVQFMYHGINEEGQHEASVSCAVNTEGPYHRRSISWAPNVFCEGAKEETITWTSDIELEKNLKQALKTTSDEVL